MKPSSDKLNSNQPILLSNREGKKRVNIPWKHGFFFQIGLIISLVAVFIVMEISIDYSEKNVGSNKDFYLEESPTIRFVVEKPPANLKPLKKVIDKKPEKITTLSSLIKVTSDVSSIVETSIKDVESPKKYSSSIVTTIKSPVVDDQPRNLENVEFVPVFPGCESFKTNKEKISCMSSKIGSFIQKKFRTDQFNNLEGNKIQRVYVQFKINKKGEITNVVSRANNLELETEGNRVIRKLPRMIPGRQGDVNVDVVYMVPILFKVE
ncbi:MAG: protein TonB [Ulvibacter sp.]|jgi:protein TonB